MARGPALTRTGKTKRRIQCNPPNKQCGGRCIPPEWDCRLEGQGTNPALKVVKSDPLAGAASLQRGATDVVKGVSTLNPARIQRGRSSIIRGIVKIAPGDGLEDKNRLRRRLEQGSSAAFAITLVGVLGVLGHRGLKTSRAYREGWGRQIDNAALRAVNSLLDVTPVIGARRNAARAAGTAAFTSMGRSTQRLERMNAVGRTAAANVRRIGMLGGLGDRVAAPNSPLLADARLRVRINDLARTSRDADDFALRATQTLFSSEGGPGGHSPFSASAAQTLLDAQYGLGLRNSINPRLRTPNGAGGFTDNPAANVSSAVRKDMVVNGLADHFRKLGDDMRADMRVRGYGDPTEDAINRYIEEQALPGMRPRLERISPTAVAQYQETMRVLISNTQSLSRSRSLARSVYASTVNSFDTYFDGIATRMNEGPASNLSPLGDGKVALAKFLRGGESYDPSRGTGYTKVYSTGHADLLIRDWYHRRTNNLRRQRPYPYVVQPATASRVAQSISRNPELPNPQDAITTLRRSGLRVQLPPINANPPRTATGGTTASTPAAPAERSGTRRTRSRSQIVADLIKAGYTQAAAGREADRIIGNRRSDAYEAARAATRARFDLRQGAERLGKPCGESHIPKAHECRKGGSGATAESTTSEPNRKKQLAIAAAVVGGALAVGVAASVALNLKELKNPENSPLSPSPNIKDLVKEMRKESGSKSSSEAMGYYYTKKSGLKPGDVVYFRHEKDPAAHYGIYLGEGKDGVVRAVIANTNDARFSWADVAEIGSTKPGVKAAQAVMTPLVKAPEPKFATQTGKPFTNEEVVKRAVRIAGTDYKFTITKDNCEALANGIAYGVPESEQLQRFRRATRAVMDVSVARGQRRQASEAIYQGRAQGRSYTSQQFVEFLKGERMFSSPEGKALLQQYDQYFETARKDAAEARSFGLKSPEDVWHAIKSYGPAVRARAMADYLLVQRTLIEMDRANP